MVHNQLQAKDDCWRIDALYKLQPNKVHSKKMQYMKVHHWEVHHNATHLHAPRELTYEIDEIYICEDNSKALALPPTLRRRCHWHSRRRDGAEPVRAAFYHDALQLSG